MAEGPNRIGRVTRCNIRGFSGGTRLAQADVPTFGTFCKAGAQQGNADVIGLVYGISIEDDELARQLAASDNVLPEAYADNQYVRPVPIEIQALSVGYLAYGRYLQALPPQPPLTLVDIFPLTSAEVRAFTERLDFLRIVYNSKEVPADDLLAAALRQAATARPDSERRGFLVDAGRECARLMAADLTRLEGLLRSIELAPGE